MLSLMQSCRLHFLHVCSATMSGSFATSAPVFDKRILDFIRCPLSAAPLEYDQSAGTNPNASATLVAHAIIDADGTGPRRIRIAYPISRDGVALLRSSDAELTDDTLTPR